MKRIFLIIGVISSLCACRQENRYLSEGEGALNLQVTVGGGRRGGVQSISWK